MFDEKKIDKITEGLLSEESEFVSSPDIGDKCYKCQGFGCICCLRIGRSGDGHDISTFEEEKDHRGSPLSMKGLSDRVKVSKRYKMGRKRGMLCSKNTLKGINNLDSLFSFYKEKKKKSKLQLSKMGKNMFLKTLSSVDKDILVLALKQMLPNVMGSLRSKFFVDKDSTDSMDSGGDAVEGNDICYDGSNIDVIEEISIFDIIEPEHVILDTKNEQNEDTDRQHEFEKNTDYPRNFGESLVDEDVPPRPFNVNVSYTKFYVENAFKDSFSNHDPLIPQMNLRSGDAADGYVIDNSVDRVRGMSQPLVISRFSKYADSMLCIDDLMDKSTIPEDICDDNWMHPYTSDIVEFDLFKDSEISTSSWIEKKDHMGVCVGSPPFEVGV